MISYRDLQKVIAPITRRISDLEMQDPGAGILVPPLHAPTHEPGGTDELAVDAAAIIGSLRTIGTTALSAGSGALTPTAGQKEALVGTDGTPSTTNKYVTDSDPRLVPPTPYVSPFYNVKDFGALGDGTTNDTQAIQDALDALGATGGTLLFPPGTYNSSAVGAITTLTLTATGDNGYEIWGLGATLLPDDTMGTALLCIGGLNNQLTVRDLLITRDPLATTTNINQHGLQISPPANNVPSFVGCLIENVRCIGHPGWGINLLNVFNAQIINCAALVNKYGGLGIGSGGNIVISGGTFNDNISSTGAGDYGIAFYSGQAAFPDATFGALVTGVTANGNGRKGIDVHHGRSIKIIGNTCIGNGAAATSSPSGIYALGEDVYKDVRDIVIAYNYIDMAGAAAGVAGWGIQAGTYTPTTFDPGSLAIIGNTIKNCNWNAAAGGIVIETPTSGLGTKRIVIADNLMIDAAGTGHTCIHFSNNPVEVEQAIITNNIIRTTAAITAAINVFADRSIITDNLIQLGGTCTNCIQATGGQGIITGNSVAGTAPTNFIVNNGGGVQHSNILTTGVVQFEPVVGAIANDLKIVKGNGTIQIASGTRAANAAISFGYTFGATPDIFCSFQSGALIAGELPGSATVQSPTATGFSFRLDVFANVAANRDVAVSWMAVGI